MLFSNLPTPLKRALLALAILAGVLGGGSLLAACAGAGHSPSGSTASSAAANATTDDKTADQQLVTDGYAVVHNVPTYGHASVGFRNTSPKYELVATYTGSNTALMKDVVTSAQQKLVGQNVTIKVVDNQIVVQTDKVTAVIKAGKAVFESMK